MLFGRFLIIEGGWYIYIYINIYIYLSLSEGLSHDINIGNIIIIIILNRIKITILKKIRNGGTCRTPLFSSQSDT